MRNVYRDHLIGREAGNQEDNLAGDIQAFREADRHAGSQAAGAEEAGKWQGHE